MKYGVSNRISNSDSIDSLYQTSSSANKSSLRRLHRQGFINLIEGVCIEDGQIKGVDESGMDLDKYRMANPFETEKIRMIEKQIKCEMGIKNIGVERVKVQKEYYHERAVRIHKKFTCILNSFEGFEVEIGNNSLEEMVDTITLDSKNETLRNDLNASDGMDNVIIHRNELRELFYERIMKSLRDKQDKKKLEVEIRMGREWGFGEQVLYFNERSIIGNDYIEDCERIMCELLEMKS